MNSFSSDFFVRNRQRLREILSEDALLVLTANGTLQRSTDTTFPFAQDRNFWYLTGLDEADVLLVMTPNSEYIVTPKSNTIRDIFDGAIDAEQLAQTSGITKIISYTLGWKQLTHDMQKRPAIYTILPGAAYHAQYGFYLNPARKRLVQHLRRIQPGVALRDAREPIASLRVVKQPEELAAIRRAVAVTTDAFADVRTAAKLASYGYEYELEADLSHIFRAAGATGHAYAPIVAAGTHATTLHYVQNSAALSKNELIVVDAGAEYDHYAADITRTISAQKPSSRQAAVLDAVVAIQTEAQKLLKPGVLLREYEQNVSRLMAKALKNLSLIDNISDTDAVRRYYPHATSHFLGLDVHDVGFYDKPLAGGMVLTCEPGIYIPEEGIGVRIEDDLVITAQGNENLSKHCSYDAYAL